MVPLAMFVGTGTGVAVAVAVEMLEGIVIGDHLLSPGGEMQMLLLME
jgi:hypothetical protein